MQDRCRSARSSSFKTVQWSQRFLSRSVSLQLRVQRHDIVLRIPSSAGRDVDETAGPGCPRPSPVLCFSEAQASLVAQWPLWLLCALPSKWAFTSIECSSHVAGSQRDLSQMSTIVKPGSKLSTSARGTGGVFPRRIKATTESDSSKWNFSSKAEFKAKPPTAL